MFLQTAFGLFFSSCRRFAELVAAPYNPSDEPSVLIEWGHVPDGLVCPTARQDWWQTAADEYLLQVPKVARFHVTMSRITVCPEPEAADTAVRLYLFGSVMGALLHLHGVLPLHGSAVALPLGAGAAVFVGVSSAGKSTLAAALSQRGYPLMADDVSAIRVSSNGCILYPGLARSKLWLKSMQFLELDLADGRSVRPDKYAFDMALAGGPRAITHVYELLPAPESNKMTLMKITGVEKLRLLDEHTFRRNYIFGLGRRGPHLGHLARLAEQVQVGKITRPISEDLSVHAMIDLLEEDWAS